MGLFAPRATPRGTLGTMDTQTRVQYVRTQEQLEAAIQRATFTGALPNDGIGSVATTGTAIVIVEQIKLSRTILLPRRAIGITISQFAKFPCIVTHGDPVFRVEGFAQALVGLHFSIRTGADGPSMFVELNDGGEGNPSDFTLRDCIAWAQEFVHTNAGMECVRAVVSGNVLVRSSGSSTDGINIAGDGVRVDGNAATSQCDVTLDAVSAGTRCYGNELDGGTVAATAIGGGNT